MPTAEAVALMNAQDAEAVRAVAAQQHEVAAAIELVTSALKKGGRLFYIGAGTSGRLGVLDAAECPPTFNTDPHLVQGIIAGGAAAMFRSQEGAEDQTAEGAAAIDSHGVTKKDVVMGIAAGGTTPYVWGALDRARYVGASTIFFCCVAPNPREPVADVVIRPLTGPEVLTGSTRLKAATATKLVLNQITTLTMVNLGKVYENLMVDLRVTNDKLKDRATRIVQEIAGMNRKDAARLLEIAGGEVKTAVVMRAYGVDPEPARKILADAAGKVRLALEKSAGKKQSD